LPGLSTVSGPEKPPFVTLQLPGGCIEGIGIEGIESQVIDDKVAPVESRSQLAPAASTVFRDKDLSIGCPQKKDLGALGMYR
jgi:hypothetical protein